MIWYKWILTLILPIVIASGVLFIYGYGLKDVSLEKLEFTRIGDITSDSFTIYGNLYLKNPSDLKVPIESVDYDIILKEKNQIISSGSIPTFDLEANKVTKVPFNHKVKWIPTTQLLLEFATKEKVYLIVNGTAKVNLPEVKKYGIPFKQEVDIKEYFVNQKLSANNLNVIDDSKNGLIGI